MEDNYKKAYKEVVEILKFGMKKTIAFFRKFEVFRLKELEVF